MTTHRSRDVRTFFRAQSPRPDPPFRPVHAVLAALLFGFIAATFLIGPVMAHIGGQEVAGREWFMRLRLAVIGLMVWNVLIVRAVPWWRTLAYVLICGGILFNIARNEWLTENPLTLSFALILMGLLIETLAVTFRPTAQERVAALTLENAELRAQAEVRQLEKQ